MINSFQDWKDTCQKEFNWLAVHLRSLTETGKARLRMCGAFLDIADWSDSATEAVEWIDGKYEMNPEIRAAIDTPMAEQLIADIRRLAKEEQPGEENLPKAGIYIQNMGMPRKYPICLMIWPDGKTEKYAPFIMGEKQGEYVATQVPPHGKLVDVADVKELFEKHFGDDQIAFQLIDSVPVIIPPKSKEQQDLEDLVERLNREGIAP